MNKIEHSDIHLLLPCDIRDTPWQGVKPNPVIYEKGQFTMCSQYKCAVCILKNDFSVANLKRTSCWQFDVWLNDLLNQQISFDCKTTVDLIL